VNPFSWPLDLYKWLDELPAISVRGPSGIGAAATAGVLAGLGGFLVYRVGLPSLAAGRAFQEIEPWTASMGQGLATGQFAWSLLLGGLGGALLGAMAIVRTSWKYNLQLWAVTGSALGAGLLVPLIQIKTGGLGPIWPAPPFWPNYAVFGATAMGLLVGLVDYEAFQPRRFLVTGAILPTVVGYFGYLGAGLATGWGGPAPAALLAATSWASLTFLLLSFYFIARAIRKPGRAGFDRGAR